ncbi:MAG: AAA family ATPase [Chloroflexi bacterium]|nr:AAA family ATPase [Chloroflexota bacterium]
MPPTRVVLFGAPHIERDGKPVAVDTRKALALLAYLATTPNGHSRDALATLLYGDFTQSHARAALRRTLSRLRQALGDEHLCVTQDNIALKGNSDLAVDVAEFHSLLADCSRHGHPTSSSCLECIPPLTRAAALYADDFLCGFTLCDSPAFDEWQSLQTETLWRQLAGALEQLARQHSAQREYDLAITYARRWLALDPLDEPAHRHLMQLYASTGQRAAALRQYQECVRILHDELGVAPLEETTRLYDAIKARGGEGERGRGGAVSPTLPLPLSPPPLVGRAKEWEALLRAYSAIRADGHFVVLEGEMGIGKTRLAEQFVEYARQQGVPTLRARAYEGSANLAYGPFVEALRAALAHAQMGRRIGRLPDHLRAEAARLVPELGAAMPEPLDSPSAQVRFFEGMAQVLAVLCADSPPGVFFIDDLHWLDAASLDLLAYVVRRLRGRALCVFGALGCETAPTPQLLPKLLAEGQRAGWATIIPLARLDESAVVELARNNANVTRAVAERLYRETEGVPFFVIEYLAAMGRDATDWALPQSAREILRSRLLSLTEMALQVLGAAAVVGRSFDFDTLRQVGGQSESETIAAVEELCQHGFVREAGAGAYNFTHEKLRALAYEETSHARRRLLHRRAAQALVARGRVSRDADARAGPVALHFRQAGQDAEAAE